MQVRQIFFYYVNYLGLHEETLKIHEIKLKSKFILVHRYLKPTHTKDLQKVQQNTYKKKSCMAL